MTGLLGFPSGYHAMKACDALLMLGTDFPYTQFFPENAEVIQVDLRGQQIGRRTAVKLGPDRRREKHPRRTAPEIGRTRRAGVFG